MQIQIGQEGQTSNEDGDQDHKKYLPIGKTDKIEKIDKTKKIKKSLLKLKIKHNQFIIPPYLNIKFMYTFGDAAMIYEESFRDPKHSVVSYFGAMFHFKRIDTLIIDKDYITLNLKLIPQSMLPAEYAIQRFKSFNDKEFKQIAENIQKVIDQFKFMNEQNAKVKQNTRNSINPQMALQVIRQKEQKEFKTLVDIVKLNPQTLKIGLYYKETQLGLSINKVILSTKLLQILGMNILQIVQEYAKFKTINLEIFSAEYYKFIFSQIIKISAQVMQKSRKKQHITYEDFYVASKGFIFKKLKINNLEIQEKVHADIIFHKLAPNISYFQISNIKQNGIILVGADESNSIRKLQFDPAINIHDEIQRLRQQAIDQKVIFF